MRVYLFYSSNSFKLYQDYGSLVESILAIYINS